MDISFYLALFASVVAAAVAVLHVVAPKTETTLDDSILERLEQLESILESLGHDTQTPTAK
jgi:phage-related protein